MGEGKGWLIDLTWRIKDFGRCSGDVSGNLRGPAIPHLIELKHLEEGSEVHRIQRDRQKNSGGERLKSHHRPW